MRIYTTYFSKVQRLPEHIVPIAISVGIPDGYAGARYKKLAPKWDFLNRWKQTHDDEYYIKCFNEQILSPLNPETVVEELTALAGSGKDIALVCYERPEKFCHRHLVSKWLQDNGLCCTEWSEIDTAEREGNIVKVHGNILNSEAQVLVNPVNCVGVMGAGLALQFKQRYPEVYARYRAVCDKGLLQPGKLQLVHVGSKAVLNFPTKMHWKDPAKYEYILAGLKKLAGTYRQHGIKSIAIPPLGCGLGGLDEGRVYEMIRDILGPTDLMIHYYAKEVK